MLGYGSAQLVVDVALTLTPTSGAPGTAVSVSGSGFGRKQKVTLTWDGLVVQTITANPQGRFSGTVITPTPAGPHTLSASSPTAAATALFTVTEVSSSSGLVIAAPVGPFTVLDGGGTQQSGVFLRNNGGGSITKQQAQHYTGYGIANMDYWPPRDPVGRTLITDCIATDIAAVPPKSMNGTGEAGFWFGNPTDAARLVAKRCAWMGMWTGANCTGSVIEDFELLEQPNVGLYVEHVTKDTTFRRFRIVSQSNGVNVEWWYGGEGSSGLTFEDGDIYCPAGKYGAFLDAGSWGCTFRRCRFWGPGDAIGLPTNLAGPTLNVVEDSCVFENAGQHIFMHTNAIG